MLKYVLALLLVCISDVNAQLVTIPIPGAHGLSITVGVGANALPLRDIRSNPAAVNITQGDNSWTEVPLGFNFPFWGKSFNTSWAMTNGMVTFQNPSESGIYDACCSGVNLTTTTDKRWNYSIFALHTDLYAFNENSQYYLRENNAITYGWYNLSQCCNRSGGNSFEIKITSKGTIDTRIAGARVGWNPVTSGMSGDLSKGEYYQYYHDAGINIPRNSSSVFSWNTNGVSLGADPCVANPLSSPTCSGYQKAYLTQQCIISVLNDPSCPGYQQAYFTYQCSINALYSPECIGYNEAYFNQQCTINPLYDRKCPGYEIAYASEQLLTKQTQQSPTSTIQPAIQVTETSTVQLVTATPIVPIISATPTQQTTPGTISLVPQTTSSSTQQSQQQTQQQSTTVRQQIQKSRIEAARKQAASRSNEVMKEAVEAKTIEQQIAAQELVITAMGYNAQFDVYKSIVLSDRIFYKTLDIYKEKENVDNSRVLRGLYGASELRHQQLIDQQHK
jgi:hypothetical protein